VATAVIIPKTEELGPQNAPREKRKKIKGSNSNNLSPLSTYKGAPARGMWYIIANSMQSKKRVLFSIFLGLATAVSIDIAAFLYQLHKIKEITTDSSFTYPNYLYAYVNVLPLTFLISPFIGGLITGFLVKNRSSYWAVFVGIAIMAITLLHDAIQVFTVIFVTDTSVFPIFENFLSHLLIASIITLIASFGGFIGEKLRPQV
jgi:hypothetical protein